MDIHSTGAITPIDLNLVESAATEVKAPDVNFQGTSVTQEQDSSSPLIHRYDSGKWQISSDGGTTWRATDKFERIHQDAQKSTPSIKDLSVFGEALKNFRYDKIDAKKQACKEELARLSPDSERAHQLTSLIKVLEHAASYHGAMIQELSPSTDYSFDPQRANNRSFSKIGHTLSALDKINSHPNQVELVAQELEKDYEQLAAYEKKLTDTRSQLLEPRQDQEGLARLHEKEVLLMDAITYQKDLIAERINYAQSLRPPSQTITPEEQSVMEHHTLRCIELNAHAEIKNLSTQLLEPRTNKYLRLQSYCFSQIIEEFEDPNPKPQVITLFSQAALLYQDASKAEREGKTISARYLRDAAVAVKITAQEEKESIPNQQSINCSTQSALLYQDAAKAETAKEGQKAHYLSGAAESFSIAAKTERDPDIDHGIREKAIHVSLKAASLYQDAADTESTLKKKKASYLALAGSALLHAVIEMDPYSDIQSTQESINASLEKAEKESEEWLAKAKNDH